MNPKTDRFTSAADGGINVFDVMDVVGSIALELVSSLLEVVLGL